MRLWALTLLVGLTSPADAHLWPYFVFSGPTDRYDHGVLGDAVEYGVLEFRNSSWEDVPDRLIARIVLPEDRVFEDLAPRQIDLNTQGRLHYEQVVVETDLMQGAQLAIYGVYGESLGNAEVRKVAATPHIGQPYRWLAPAGIADFDGDGQNDIAYVETPHLGKILKIVTLEGDRLVPIVDPRAGFSNHRIGQDFITSDVRRCDGRTELLTPNADWSALMAVRVDAGQIVAEQTAFAPTLEGIAQAQRCE